MISKTFTDMMTLTSDPVAAAVLTLCAVIREERGDGLLTVKQAAQRLGLSRQTVYQMCKEGEIRSRKIGRAVRIAPADLEGVELPAPTLQGVNPFNLSHDVAPPASSRLSC